MWSQVQKLIHTTPEPMAGANPPVRQPSMKLNNLGPGSVITFAGRCPLPQLAGQKATITQVRTYKFGDDISISYAMQVAGRAAFSLTIAEDAEGFYLAVSRELDAAEQDRWFGRDALSFFTEPSTAKTIRCKADLAIEGDWAAPRYVKSVDWVAGSVLLGRMSTATAGRQVKQFHYNLLVNDGGDRALEIEHEDATGENRVLITVYRPVEDIASVAEPVPHVPLPEPMIGPSVANGTPALMQAAGNDEPPLFAAPSAGTSAPRRYDFRRLNSMEPAESIHVSAPPLELDTPVNEQALPPLPSFLVSREKNYLSLDEVIPPETERVRCDLRSAKALIDYAIARNVRVRDIMREMVGLESILNDEVIFEMPLSDADYRMLAMRYKLRPDQREQMRQRLQQELNERLHGVSKKS